MTEKKVIYDDLLKIIPNKYELTIVVGKRARKLGIESKSISKNGDQASVINRCLNEILDGKLVIGDADEMAAEETLTQDIQLDLD